MSDVTRILSAIEHGDPHAASQLLPLVYDELRQLAAQKLAHEKPGQTLQPTALVHEAYLRLVGEAEKPHWDSHWHFFAAAEGRVSGTGLVEEGGPVGRSGLLCRFQEQLLDRVGLNRHGVSWVRS